MLFLRARWKYEKILMKSPSPTGPKESLPVHVSARQRVAEALFCSDKLAMTDFRQMDADDWKLHAARAWEVAGIFVAETPAKVRR
jgi:hypothetical protein